jgi:PEGA domain
MKSHAALCVLVIFLTWGPLCLADPDAGVSTDNARALFLEGVKLVEASSWAQALDAFERAQAISPHAITLYNMALCRRALGQGLRALDLLEASLAGDTLPAATREQAQALKRELGDLVARVTVTVESEDTSVSVDGRPLELRGDLALAGIRPPLGGDEAVPIGSRTRVVLVDAGERTWVFFRKGYEKSVKRIQIAPGASVDLPVLLTLLPSLLVVDANRTVARVFVDKQFAGLAPLRLSHASGKTVIAVEKKGFDPFETTAILLPGEQTRVLASLRESAVPITRKWWFYGLIGVAVVGAGVTSYVLLKPKEPNDGGTLNWVVR